MIASGDSGLGDAPEPGVERGSGSDEGSDVGGPDGDDRAAAVIQAFTELHRDRRIAADRPPTPERRRLRLPDEPPAPVSDAMAGLRPVPLDFPGLADGVPPADVHDAPASPEAWAPPGPEPSPSPAPAGPHPGNSPPEPG